MANLPRRWCELLGLAYSGGVGPGTSFQATGCPVRTQRSSCLVI